MAKSNVKSAISNVKAQKKVEVVVDAVVPDNIQENVPEVFEEPITFIAPQVIAEPQLVQSEASLIELAQSIVTIDNHDKSEFMQAIIEGAEKTELMQKLSKIVILDGRLSETIKAKILKN